MPVKACRWAAGGIACSSGRGRRCCAVFGETPSATSRRTGRNSRTCISPATAASAMRTGTSGSWAASTTEVESALVDHPKVAEATVCGKMDELTGQAIVAFVSLKGSDPGSRELADELRDHVGTKLGRFTRPKYLTFTPELPKTRSGKIMRRLLRDIAEGRMLGDTTTLADSSVVEELRKRALTEGSKEE